MKRILLLCIVFGCACALTKGQADWCIPVVDVAGSYGSGISHVTLDGSPEIDRSSPTTEGYIFAGSSTTLMKGAFYTITVNKVSGVACSDDNVRAYIDFNGDHVFNEGTETVGVLNYAGDGVDAFTFLVPYNAVEGVTRMRVCEKMTSECGAVGINACGVGDTAGYHGEIEDYTVTIEGQVGVPEVATAPAATVTITDGELILDAALSEAMTGTLDVIDPSGRVLYSKDLGMLPATPFRRSLGSLESHGVLIARLMLDGKPVVFRLLAGS